MTSNATPHPWHAEAETARARLAEPGSATIEQLRERSGIEFLQAIGEGNLPSVPIGQLMGFVPVEWEPGRMVFQGTPGAQHYNPLGTSMVVMRRHCLIPAWDAPSIACCLPARAIRRWN